MRRYVDKCVIVTGGAGGIGEGCIHVFFEAGADVVIADRDEARGEQLATELRSAGRPNRALFICTDVSVTSDLQALVDKAVASFGRSSEWITSNRPIA